MKKILSKKALSLLELIIASVIVVIVVLGIFAINSVLSNNNQDYGQRYSVKSATQVTLNHILNNASKAIGSETIDSKNNLDEGILIGNEVGDPNSFCIHQDIPILLPDNTTVNLTPGTPPNYANSRWLCYTWYPPTDLNYPYQIRYCAMQFDYTNTKSNRGAAGPCGAGSLYLGTAYGTAIIGAFANNVSFNATSGFSITIQNCLNNSETINSLPTCNGSGNGKSSDPVNNPEAQVSGSVFPSQEGMQQNYKEPL